MILWFVVSIVLALVVPSFACDWQPKITATETATSHLTLRWDEFLCETVPTHYVVNVVHLGGSLFVSNTTSTTVKITDLSPCTFYYIHVCVSDGECSSTHSIATTCKAPEDISPSPYYTADSNMFSLRLSWKAPLFNKALNYYRVRCIFGWTGEILPEWNVSSPTLLITGLDSRNIYIFDVTSISKSSEPGFSAESTIVHKLSFRSQLWESSQTKGSRSIRDEEDSSVDSSTISDPSSTTSDSTTDSSFTPVDSSTTSFDSSSTTSDPSSDSSSDPSTDFSTDPSTTSDSTTSTTESVNIDTVTSDSSTTDSTGSSTDDTTVGDTTYGITSGTDSTTTSDTSDGTSDGGTYDTSTTDDGGYGTSTTDDGAATSGDLTSGIFDTITTIGDGTTTDDSATTSDTTFGTSSGVDYTTTDESTTGDESTTNSSDSSTTGFDSSTTEQSTTGLDETTSGEFTTTDGGEMDTSTTGSQNSTGDDLTSSTGSQGTTGDLTSSTGSSNNSTGNFSTLTTGSTTSLPDDTSTSGYDDSSTSGFYDSTSTSGDGTTSGDSSSEESTTSGGSTSSDDSTTTYFSDTSGTINSTSTGELTSGSTNPEPGNSSTGASTTGGYSTGTTGDDLTSGSSTGTTGFNDTTTTSTSTMTSGTTTGGIVTIQQVKLNLQMTGNQSLLDISTFKGLLAGKLSISVDKIQNIEIEPISPNKNDAKRAATLGNETASDISFMLKAIIYTPDSVNQTSTIVRQFLMDNTSVINQYFTLLGIGVVAVDVTVVITEVTSSGQSVTTGPASTTSLSESPKHTKSTMDKYFLYVVVGVPSVVMVGAIAGVIFVIFWRNRNAARRKTHWDMHKMYSGISMMDHDA